MHIPLHLLSPVTGSMLVHLPTRREFISNKPMVSSGGTGIGLQSSGSNAVCIVSLT